MESVGVSDEKMKLSSSDILLFSNILYVIDYLFSLQ